MAWFTTKSGKHINTDWFEKEAQIKKNKEVADKLNGVGHPIKITKPNTPGNIVFGGVSDMQFKSMAKPGSTGTKDNYKGAKQTGGTKEKATPEAIAQRFANNLSKQGISNEWEIKAWLMSKSSGYRNSLAKDIGIPGKGDERVDALAHKLYVTGKGEQDTPKVETPKVEPVKNKIPKEFNDYIPKEYKPLIEHIELGKTEWNEHTQRWNTNIEIDWQNGEHSSFQNKAHMKNSLLEMHAPDEFTLKNNVEPVKVEPPKPVEPEYERTSKMDWIDKRIEGKQAELDKLEKKMERIQKAQASDWKENNPYYYNERDLRSTQKDIDNAKKALEDYKKQMEQEIEKAKSRNVPVITDFLNDWEQKSIEYFNKEKGIYEEALKEHRAKDHEYTEWFNYPHKFIPNFDRSNPEHRELYNKKWKESRQYDKEFKAKWHYVTQFYDGSGTWEENMKRAIAKEKVAKYDDIITRTNDLIGQITDAGGLRIGMKGDLNGVIIGTKGKATVETIGAGGYNIQRYHFRTLINKLKEK